MTQRIVPMIAYEDAAAAIDWLTEAFGFREREGQRSACLREHRVQACLPRGEVQAAWGACALRGVCG